MAIISPSVSDFIANFQGGGARPNLYNVILTFPASIVAGLASVKASFTCKAASLPSSNMGIATAPFMGRQVKLLVIRHSMTGQSQFWMIQIFLSEMHLKCGLTESMVIWAMSVLLVGVIQLCILQMPK